MVWKIGIGREGDWRVVCGWQRYNLGERQASDFRQTSGSSRRVCVYRAWEQWWLRVTQMTPHTGTS